MSVPLSLRICCAAAMAPALTESSSQSRLQLPGSPPPVVSENDNFTSGLSQSKISSAVIRGKITRSNTTDFQNGRGLLKPIQGNSYQQRLLTEKVKKGLQELCLPANLASSVSQRTIDNTPDNLSREHYNQNSTSKKMNQPSNGNGPNGTGSRFIKQTSLIEEQALNGHKNNHSTGILQFGKTVLDSNSGNKNLTHNLVLNHSKNQNMCHTAETSSGAVAPTTSSQGQNNAQAKATVDIPGNIVTTQGMKKISDQELGVKPADMANDAVKKHFQLERKSQFLLRRLRRLQGHHLESQVKMQLKTFVDFQHQHLQTVASKAIRPFSENTFFNCNDVKNLSTSNLVTLVRKLQASQPKPPPDANVTNNRKGVLIMEQGVSSETERKSGLLRTHVRHWNDAVDSDETESSSGGESCEEWEDCPVMSDKKVPTPL